MVFEMTHQFSLVPALMLGALVCEGVVYLLSRKNFYEEALIQDGHELEHIMPPRDLRSWRQLPVSVIAKSSAAVVTDRDPETLKAILETKPYERFPLVEDGRLKGTLSREEIRSALKEDRIPVPVDTPTCTRSSMIKDIQLKLIESPVGMVIVMDRNNNSLLSVVTLHDLLRAEASLSERTDD
jgi:CIC family chloride channel protein